MTETEKTQLIQAAAKAAVNAYAPYSKFRVGAAVLGAHGVYVGANIENASYPVGLCAERAAIASAVSQGDRTMRAIAIAFPDGDPAADIHQRVPCGACLQWLAEFATDDLILLCGDSNEFALRDLLPTPFRLT